MAPTPHIGDDGPLLNVGPCCYSVVRALDHVAHNDSLAPGDGLHLQGEAARSSNDSACIHNSKATRRILMQCDVMSVRTHELL